MEPLITKVEREAAAMASHALRAGIAVPEWVFDAVAPEGPADPAGAEEAARALLRAHGELSRRVRPFTPDLLTMLETEETGSRIARLFGPIRIARRFMGMVVLSILVFLAVSFSHYLKDPRYGNIFTSSGWPLFVNELFFLSAAAVGASFSGLLQMNKELAAGSFAPAAQASYWVRFVLGLVAGLLLATVLRLGAVAPEHGGTQIHFQAAALALMGGFSSNLVQRIAQRLIDALEALVRGGAEGELAAREASQQQEIESTIAAERTRTKLLLSDMERRLAAGASPEEIAALARRGTAGDGEPPAA